MHMANEPRLEDSEQNYTFATTRDILEVQELRACGDGQLENVIVPFASARNANGTEAIISMCFEFEVEFRMELSIDSKAPSGEIAYVLVVSVWGIWRRTKPLDLGGTRMSG